MGSYTLRVVLYRSCGSYTGTKSLVVSKLGFGPRASARGENFVGLADGVSVVYWNPAGLSPLDSCKGYLVHKAWFAKPNDEYPAFALLTFLSNGPFN